MYASTWICTKTKELPEPEHTPTLQEHEKLALPVLNLGRAAIDAASK